MSSISENVVYVTCVTFHQWRSEDASANQIIQPLDAMENGRPRSMSRGLETLRLGVTWSSAWGKVHSPGLTRGLGKRLVYIPGRLYGKQILMLNSYLSDFLKSFPRHFPYLVYVILKLPMVQHLLVKSSSGGQGFVCKYMKKVKLVQSADRSIR